MTDARPTIESEIERYLRTGETDPYHAAWSGTFAERVDRSHDDLRGALIREVRLRTEGRAGPALPDFDPVALVRARVEPMVRGLFPRTEQEFVLSMLVKSAVFVTAANIEPLLLDHGDHHAAWIIANLHLGSVGAELLGPSAPRTVGFCEGTTCFVSSAYFSENDPFADFLVHEAAHVFHNCKRDSVGLRQTRTKEWLLDVEFRQRETFAHACEAFAGVLRRAKSVAARRALAEEYGRSTRVMADHVVHREVADIIQSAAVARNGWKVILERCSPDEKPIPRSTRRPKDAAPVRDESAA